MTTAETDVPLTRETVKAMTWDDRDATTVGQRRQYVRDVFGIAVEDDADVPVGVLCLSPSYEITAADLAAASAFAATHLRRLRGALTPSDTSGFSPTELSTLARFEAAGDPWDDSDETGADRG